MRLVRAQLGCAQMGNAVKDQCHSEPQIMWVVEAWVGAHLGRVLQRIALVYRHAKKWRSTGYKPSDGPDTGDRHALEDFSSWGAPA